MVLAAATVASLATLGVRASAGAALFAGTVAHGRAAPGAGIVPPRNPPKNLPPVPNFYAYCTVRALDDTAVCNSKALEAIDRREGRPIGSLRFSLAKFLKLSVVDQLFTIADLERVCPRRAAHDGPHSPAGQGGPGRRRQRQRPQLVGQALVRGAQVLAWGSNWAGGSESALGADYGWMYDDGYGGHNGGCESPAAAGCWGTGTTSFASGGAISPAAARPTPASSWGGVRTLVQLGHFVRRDLRCRLRRRASGRSTPGPRLRSPSGSAHPKPTPRLSTREQGLVRRQVH